MLRLLRHTMRFPLLSALSILLAFLCTALVLVLPAVTMRFIDVIIGQNRPDLILSTALIGGGAILARHILSALRTYLNHHLEARLTHLIRIELYNKLQRLPIKWFDKNSSGQTMSRLTDDVPSMDRVVVEGIDQALAAALQFLVVLAYLLYHSWQLTLVTLLPLPLIAIITIWWSRRAEPKWRASSEAGSALNAILHDNLAGIRQIKAYNVEADVLETFSSASQHVRQQHLAVMKGQAIVWPAVSFIAESGIILMVAFGATWALQGIISPGIVIAFLVAWGFLFDPISRINALSQTFTRGLVSAKRVFAIIDSPDESHLSTGLTPEKFLGNIEFKDLSFSYNSESLALQNINLSVKAGQTIAFVGKTGSGKSTLLNLLSRFYEPSSGEILLDGIPLSKISKQWLRNHTGFVTQDSFLFNTSIRENLQLAQPSATDADLWSVLAAANAEEFVRALPNGLDTQTGERGIRFSGGEKQRISIARALLKNPPLLLLDEASSALDNHTEKLVQEALENLRADRTSFVIAHRLTTIHSADLICVLEKGKIVQRGTHQQLISSTGPYTRMSSLSSEEAHQG